MNASASPEWVVTCDTACSRWCNSRLRKSVINRSCVASAVGWQAAANSPGFAALHAMEESPTPDSSNHFSEAWETPLQCLLARSSKTLQRDKRSGSWRLIIMVRATGLRSSARGR